MKTIASRIKPAVVSLSALGIAIGLFGTGTSQAGHAGDAKSTPSIEGWLQLAVATSREAAQADLDDVNRSFMIKGKPIHPGILHDFQPLLSDSLPYIVTIDLAAAAGSNKYFEGDVKSDQRNWYFVEDDGARFSYSWIGRLDTGLHVVRTVDSTGGTGLFNSLNFLEAGLATGFDNDGQAYFRVDMTTVRLYALGDRWEGTIKLQGNQVLLTRDGGSETVTLDAERP